MPKIPLVIATTRSQAPRVHGASIAADGRKVRTLSVGIFAELLPWSTTRIATLRRTLHPLRPRPSVDDAGGRQSGGASTPLDTTYNRPMPATRAGKETLPMKVYRTESRYYFSSKQLLPVGSLVFFSAKLRRYVHPTDGTLLDPHPRLQLLSEAESQEFAARWQEALVRF
jgi:hypothetical protein